MLFMGTTMLAYAINPTANGDRFDMNEDDTLSGNVLTADTPDSGDGTLQVQSFTIPGLSGETFSGVGADGAFTYTPPADFSGRVTFTYRDRKHNDTLKTMTLNAEEFIRRFLLHVLPGGFVRIRYFGFLANRHKRENVQIVAHSRLQTWKH